MDERLFKVGKRVNVALTFVQSTDKDELFGRRFLLGETAFTIYFYHLYIHIHTRTLEPLTF